MIPGESIVFFLGRIKLDLFELNFFSVRKRANIFESWHQMTLTHIKSKEITEIFTKFYDEFTEILHDHTNIFTKF
jgi:hypothetical protein